MRTRTLLSGVALSISLLFPAFSFAQAFNGPGDEQGIYPSRTYQGTDFESVNMATGRVAVHIPLVEDHSQRGGLLNHTYSLSLSGSGNWYTYQFASNYPVVWKCPWNPCQPSGAPPIPPGLMFTVDGLPSLVGRTVYHDREYGIENTAPYLQMQDWSRHPLPLSIPGSSYTETIDGSGFRVDANGITDRWGVRGGVLDPNGNELTNFTVGAGVSMTDTLGRAWTTSSTSDFSGCPAAVPGATLNGAYLWNTPGANGGTRIFKFCYSTIPLQTNFGHSGVTELNTTLSVMTGVVLPNLKTYEFDYDSYGDIRKITLPTGGYISYTWRNLASGGLCSVYAAASRTVSSRTVYDGANSYTWNYPIKGVVTDPLGNDTVYGSNNCQDVGSIQYYSGSRTTGTLVKTETKTYQTISDPYITEVYQDDGNPPTLLLSTTTTWPNGQASQTSLTYDPGFTWSDSCNTDSLTSQQCNQTPQQGYYGLVTSETHSDYGTNGSPGTPLSTTNTSYLALSNSSYLNANLLDLKSSVVVLNPSGYKCAETDYAYDDPTRLFPSNVTQQHVAAPDSVRGDVSSVTQQLSSTPCQSNASWSPVTSYHNAYDTGTTYQSIDPLSHTTTYAYSATYYGAYATTITNALNQTTSIAFDFNTGLVSSTTDPNSLTTSHTYDNMLRLIQSNYPDGGARTITYQESSYPFSTTVSSKLNSTTSLTEVSVLDGLGRPTQTQLTSDPQGTVFTDTTYDALGRVGTVSNPHRACGTDPTSSCGVTTYAYDALSRKITETYPDGSALTTAYCGASTLVTDPTKRWRRSRADGLGRLVEVDEPNAIGATVASTGCPGSSEPIWITNYTYNPLGMTNVLQNGSRPRSFTYDSVSRLLTSTNPEVGTLTYTYNLDGPVHTKTDARHITTTYTYDPLHRELTRTYSNSDPTVTTIYDQSACLGLAHCQNIGHRTSMTDAAGSESWAYQQNNQAQYPDFPHIFVDKRTTGGVTKTGSYYSDLVGNIRINNYPTGRTINTQVSAASRVVQVYFGPQYAFSQVPASPGCPINNVCYTPQGTIYSMAIYHDFTTGFNGLNILETYNSRLQPQEIKAYSSGGNAMDLTYNYTDPVNGGNAGHVFSITNHLDITRSQTFTYDQVNRITAAQTTSTFATSPGHCWAETYQFDNSSSGGAWGNLTQITQPTNSNYTGCTYEVGFSKTADGNNHLSGFSYDASGNTSGDGYNSYTWNAENQLNVTGSSSYLYDGDGRRVAKANTAVPPVPYKLYWYGPGGEILGETDASGNTLNEYVFLGGKRLAMLPAGANALLYAEDLLGTSRIMTGNTGVVCYDADFYPYGGERAPYTDTCAQNFYKFEGKERDAETGNDDFEARYYSNRFGRWLSADWSAIPEPVPYADLSNPQTLNLYSMVADDPESFADLDGHDGETPKPAGKCAGFLCWLVDLFHSTDTSSKEHTGDGARGGGVSGGGFSGAGRGSGGNSLPGGSTATKPPLPNPSTAAAGIAIPAVVCEFAEPCGIIVVGGAVLVGGTIYFAQNNKQVQARLAGLAAYIQEHLDKIGSHPPDFDPQDHWKKEIRAAIETMKRIGRRLPKSAMEKYNELIQQAERALMN